MNNKTILTRVANKMGIEPNYMDDLVIIVFGKNRFGYHNIEFHKVDAIQYKNLAVHVAYGWDGYEKGIYTISHVPSGMVVAKDMTFDQMVNFDRLYSLDDLNTKADETWELYDQFTRDEILGERK